MQNGKSDFQSWLQTAAVIGTIIATVGFFWLNVPSKDDMNRQFTQMSAEMNRRFGEVNDRLDELRSDIQRLDQDYKNHLAKHNEGGRANE